ncbi:MAG: M28 family peptidase [Cytophagales bacterium]|nr:M28 family peptidase [Cytophagales bacterium]
MHSLAFAILISLIFFTCTKKKKYADEQPAIVTQAKAPAFNADSAYSYIYTQVTFTPRVPNTPAHQKCGDYLIAMLDKYGCKVYVQSYTIQAYDGKILKLRNIIGAINTDVPKRIILASHWDSRPFADQEPENKNIPIDGANDGASGVGVLLEIARSIQASDIKPTVGIDIILFDGEDYGQPDFSPHIRKEDTWCLGSQYWAQNRHIPGYTAYCGILLDMVGAQNSHFYMEGTSMTYAPDLVRKVWNTAISIGYAQYFVLQISDGIIDDHYYINKMAKIPMIDIIDHDQTGGQYFGSYWHTLRDNMQIIDRNTLKAVGQTLLQTVYQE